MKGRARVAQLEVWNGTIPNIAILGESGGVLVPCRFVVSRVVELWLPKRAEMRTCRIGGLWTVQSLHELDSHGYLNFNTEPPPKWWT